MIVFMRVYEHGNRPLTYHRSRMLAFGTFRCLARRAFDRPLASTGRIDPGRNRCHQVRDGSPRHRIRRDVRIRRLSNDFVLMDVKMPLLDGLEAAIEIRALDREDARTVPIIALTANTFQEDREDAAAAGMDGFIPKPFDAQQLYETLRSYLPRKG